MSKPLSEQQEAFCRYVVEGMNQTDAYIEAGYKTSNRKAAGNHASRLMENGRIQDRLSELRGNAAENAEVDLEWLIREASATYLAAKADKAYGPAVSALKEIGILTGERIEKRENTNRNVTDVDELSNEELDALLQKELAREQDQAKDSVGQSSSVH